LGLIFPSFGLDALILTIHKQHLNGRL
jgi:hypothetical protein